ncbi:hypothetical protein [Bacteroides heparinolyticus]|uniref:hypothetical protein n=1 Tax=Prevotella heparinolytica TaxID=28113 RepID=UPI00359F446D
MDKIIHFLPVITYNRYINVQNLLGQKLEAPDAVSPYNHPRRYILKPALLGFEERIVQTSVFLAVHQRITQRITGQMRPCSFDFHFFLRSKLHAQQVAGKIL